MKKWEKLFYITALPTKSLCQNLAAGMINTTMAGAFTLPRTSNLPKNGRSAARTTQTAGFTSTSWKPPGLKILDFQQHSVLAWLAELMKHRDAADSKRYRILAKKFIEKYGMDTRDYDVICGWRANASYFYIAKEFVRDNIDVDILEDLLSLGGLGIQYCIKSEAAYANLKEITDELLAVDYTEFNDRYNQRDITARKRMRELVDSDANTVTKVFSTLFER